MEKIYSKVLKGFSILLVVSFILVNPITVKLNNDVIETNQYHAEEEDDFPYYAEEEDDFPYYAEEEDDFPYHANNDEYDKDDFPYLAKENEDIPWLATTESRTNI